MLGLYTEEEMSIAGVVGSMVVRKTGVLGEEHGSLNGLLELLVVEGQEGRRTTP